jgi:UDP-N-acetylglucosamine diphosphorylase / glucose-1-phosphate thymidylyltransferase / UDP-N-acetylgalactosamine diphosphorylase / glucosamine-1-phosphate N-acetyltransferase / galactosamine-1-phosphate N-acetyltransferase
MIKAVILAGGNGVRMQPMTVTRPKPLLRVVDKTIIEHNLDSLDGLVKEVIIVVGYKGEMIKDLIKERYKSIKVRYVVQENQIGTGDAAYKSIDFLDDKFILLNGDDLYSRNDIKNILKKYPSILLGKVKNPSFFGVVECGDKYVKNLVEKPDRFPEKSMVNTGLYFLDKSIFDFKIQKSDRGEYEFTDYIRALLLNERLYFKEAKEWMPISYPWNLLEANEMILSQIKRNINGVVEKNCVINGEVKIEKGAVIKSGCHLRGPVYIKKDSVIGPNSTIYGNTIIGENVFIGTGVEIHNSVIGYNTSINSASYIGDSIIGDNCYLESSVVLNNYLEGKKIKSFVKGVEINTERLKFGSVLGDEVLIGSNSSLIPGVKIFSKTKIKSSSIITENIDEKK